ncbi:sulfurtransferase [Clostridium sp. D2Q-11]|uniref:Sulfurtransferase n=1 Tax=Anaeromonas frigoriresistens TaxID=2683708 RepID=A0A942UU47_9FIRM|nr:sulfurtransferase [Anaeromonas frigoriresistens]MBS4538035.1 sulfurtransferase [Anaeromonas frigoriresistens]
MKKLVVLLMVLFVAATAIGCGGPEVKTSKELEKQQNKYEEYANQDILISAVDAKDLIENEDNIAIIDIRKSPEYLIGHVEGAINVWRPDYSAEEEEYDFGGMRADKEKMEAFLGKNGIDNETLILLYDASGDYDAARLWWQLDMYGHKNVKLIDGGIDGWKAAGLDTTVSKPEVEEKEYKFTGEVDESKLATVEDVMAAMKDDNVVILDTRSIEEATGEDLKSGAFRKGRIPSGVWIEYKEAINTGDGADMTFKNLEELKKMYEEAGITKDKIIIPYCQSGVRSAHTTFVLTQLLGYENVKNYDGSWIEWSYNEDLPLETGDVE